MSVTTGQHRRGRGNLVIFRHAFGRGEPLAEQVLGDRSHSVVVVGRKFEVAGWGRLGQGSGFKSGWFMETSSMTLRRRRRNSPAFQASSIPGRARPLGGRQPVAFMGALSRRLGFRKAGCGIVRRACQHHTVSCGALRRAPCANSGMLFGGPRGRSPIPASPRRQASRASARSGCAARCNHRKGLRGSCAQWHRASKTQACAWRLL